MKPGEVDQSLQQIDERPRRLYQAWKGNNVRKLPSFPSASIFTASVWFIIHTDSMFALHIILLLSPSIVSSPGKPDSLLLDEHSWNLQVQRLKVTDTHHYA